MADFGSLRKESGRRTGSGSLDLSLSDLIVLRLLCLWSDCAALLHFLDFFFSFFWYFWEWLRDLRLKIFLVYKSSHLVFETRFPGEHHVKKMPHQTWSDHGNRVFKTWFIGQNRVFKTWNASKKYSLKTWPTNYNVWKSKLISHFGPKVNIMKPFKKNIKVTMSDFRCVYVLVLRLWGVYICFHSS